MIKTNLNVNKCENKSQSNVNENKDIIMSIDDEQKLIDMENKCLTLKNRKTKVKTNRFERIESE
jgi:hypothetical protein